MIERISSGVPWLDEVIDGGFPKGRAILVEGNSGIGKSILAYHFTKHSLVSNEHALYFTTNTNSCNILNDAEELCWDLQIIINKNLFTIINIQDYFKEWRSHEIDSSFIDNYLQQIKNIIETTKAKRVIFDPALPEIYSFNSKTTVEFYAKLINLLEEKKLEATSLIITLLKLLPIEDEMIKHHASGVLKMFFIENAGKISRQLYINKMRNTNVPNKYFEFDIVKDYGLILK